MSGGGFATGATEVLVGTIPLAATTAAADRGRGQRRHVGHSFHVRAARRAGRDVAAAPGPGQRHRVRPRPVGDGVSPTSLARQRRLRRRSSARGGTGRRRAALADRGPPAGRPPRAVAAPSVVGAPLRERAPAGHQPQRGRPGARAPRRRSRRPSGRFDATDARAAALTAQLGSAGRADAGAVRRPPHPPGRHARALADRSRRRCSCWPWPPPLDPALARVFGYLLDLAEPADPTPSLAAVAVTTCAGRARPAPSSPLVRWRLATPAAGVARRRRHRLAAGSAGADPAAARGADPPIRGVAARDAPTGPTDDRTTVAPPGTRCCDPTGRRRDRRLRRAARSRRRSACPSRSSWSDRRARGAPRWPPRPRPSSGAAGRRRRRAARRAPRCPDAASARGPSGAAGRRRVGWEHADADAGAAGRRPAAAAARSSRCRLRSTPVPARAA